jgi:hypothetical protein
LTRGRPSSTADAGNGTDRLSKTLCEIGRVLKPGGSLHLLDFKGRDSHGSRLGRLIHASPRLDDNSEGRILALMRQAGLSGPAKVSEGAMLLGHLAVAYYRVSVPDSRMSDPAPAIVEADL